jgi:hypothetical protein
MSKLLLISVIICLLAIPTISARDPQPKRGLKKTMQRMTAYYAFYAFALMFLWGRC